MTILATVNLWGTPLGTVTLKTGERFASFQYDAAFSRNGLPVSPLMMPLSGRCYCFPELFAESFYGLPGLLSDSLPDKFGTTVVNAWLSGKGRSPDTFNAIERLCHLGNRGMGALEFLPATGPCVEDRLLDVAVLVRLSNAVLAPGARLADADAMADMLRVCTSAGGSRAKAVVAWNPRTHGIGTGRPPGNPEYEDWLIKFDGISNNRDKEAADPQGYGAMEFAYYRMATDCGIRMSECRLLEEGGRQHFITRRFERLDDGDKLHMQSLAALAHLDFNQAGAYSYEQVFDVLEQLDAPASDARQLFRRVVFNIIARNQDDHVKNMAFLMDRQGRWSLSPAFDLTCAYHPGGRWTDRHQMTLSGKRDHFTLDDLMACGKRAGLKAAEARQIVADIREVVSRWREYAEAVSVFPQERDRIQSVLRLDMK
ncbi:type II toxin-antitoxin system HipA family toxin [Desulfosarcina sp. OttesenSCG-928-G10]|nr:type II toxin-antitoxin system HipA family toxin [Desulfosarcina sp. OttesenSCG-928-G10]